MATNETSKESSTPSLPLELILEIFLRLPSKSLQRLRCVLDDDLSNCLKTFTFQQKHAVNILKNPKNEQVLILNDLHIIIRSIDPYGSNNSSLSLSKNLSSTRHYNLTQVFKDIFPNKKEYISCFNCFRLIGASNGLICLFFTLYRVTYETTKHFILWNPCTGEHHVLPKAPESESDCRIICGFGYDTANKTYKLVIITDYVTHFYDLSTNVWKIVDAIRINVHEYLDCYVTDQFGQYLNDALHWMVSQTEIVSIGLSTEVSTRLKLPQCCSSAVDVDNWPNVGVLKGCLSVLCYQRRGGELSVWVMKEYGDEESWAYISTINLQRNEIGFRPSRMLYRPLLWVSDDDKMLFLIDGKLAFYSKDGKLCYFMHPGFKDSSRGVVHVDTLVSPNPEVYSLANNGDGKTRVLK